MAGTALWLRHITTAVAVTVAELKAFIALWSPRCKNHGVGQPVVRELACYQEIMRILWFDKTKNQCVRLQHDKFALVSVTWSKFVQNSVACYKTGASITIDEQLFPTKA